ncbi:hypothetical protein PRNO82_03129 [Planktothrix rubescens]|nr:hypothetical protein PRNO82_03129 [Planktothrix rubescens]
MSLETIGEIPLNYYLIAFDSQGNERTEPNGLLSQQLAALLSYEPITDVFIFSHGWLGDIPSAKRQYNNWIKAMASQHSDRQNIQQNRLQNTGRNFRPLLIGLHWPSKPWGDEELTDYPLSLSSPTPPEQLIKQYTQSLVDTSKARQALQTIFSAATQNLNPPQLPQQVRDAYEVLNQETALGSEGEGAAPGDDRESFDAEMIFESAEEEASRTVGFNLDGLLAPLRTLSFWKMKDRARQFGETGGLRLLKTLQESAKPDIRFHLMGHSFGCIVASSILVGPKEQNALIRPIDSLVLVQGALSLWSYCSEIPVAPGRKGYFSRLITEKRVAGPIITTRSRYDTAVGKMYPIGAGIRRQIEFAPGELPKYGGLGTFGAQGSGLELVEMEMLPLEQSYSFKPGLIYNLDSSFFICEMDGSGGAHNDIAKPEVAHAVWEATIGR